MPHGSPHEQSPDPAPAACSAILRAGVVRALAAALLVSSTLALGCSVTRPGVKAVEGVVAERGATTVQVDIVLELTNPGETEVELVQYDYLVAFEDGSSYGGRWAALRALPPGQTVRAIVPAVIPAASAGLGAKWDARGSVSYRDPQSFARILYEAGILRTETAFSGSGTLRSAGEAGAATTAPSGE